VSEATWWRHLRGDPTRFLLADEEPGVVWRALVELFARPSDSPAVTRARLAARDAGAAAELLARQDPLGYWGSPAAYGARWGGTSWHVLALAGLGADPEDPRVARGAEILLETLQPRSGGFSASRGRPPSPCFTAEVCGAMARFGYAHHPRVREAVAWLVDHDGGKGLWSCPELRHLVDGACPIAAVAVLRFVVELPAAERAPVSVLASRAGRGLLDRGLFLEGRLARTDILDALHTLARLEWEAEPSILAALRGVLARQDEEGRWTPSQPAPFGESASRPSRWLTLKALVAVARYGDALPAVPERPE
jgi:hypothetical protein